MIAHPSFGPVGGTDTDVQDFWISGYPTAGIADDQEVGIKGDFCIFRRKTYTTTLAGQRTIFVLEQVDA
jgi:hypothetical protein